MPGPRPGQSHLWMVLTDPDAATQKVIAVMVVSERPTTDHTVTLNVGDHPFIEHASNVDYRTTRPFPVSKLASVIVGSGELRENLSKGVLKSVRKGVFTSSRTPNDIKEMCGQQFDEEGDDIS